MKSIKFSAAVLLPIAAVSIAAATVQAQPLIADQHASVGADTHQDGPIPATSLDSRSGAATTSQAIAATADRAESIAAGAPADIATDPNAENPDPVANGAAVGAGIGAVLGGVSGAISGLPLFIVGAIPLGALGAVYGAISGAVIGAIVGAIVPTEVPQVLP
ncbi:hypothetical protein AB0C34_10745 [Nocardia sp. NPDC049220]|uniref:hypothetical protein n=1 Tax=Nocardia sp. NPDC049220 TaxID=3155273 RepID=UPI0033D96985